MNGNEPDSVRSKLLAIAGRLPHAPWITPEIVAEVVDGVLTRAAVAIMIEQPPSAPKALAADLERLGKRLDGLDGLLATLSPGARAALRQASKGTGKRNMSRLRLEIARLGVQVEEAKEQLQRERGLDRPASREAVVGMALVGAIERITGKPATYTTHPDPKALSGPAVSGSAVSGPAVDFTCAALAALEIDAKVETVLRGARDRRREAKAWRKQARGDRPTPEIGEADSA